MEEELLPTQGLKELHSEIESTSGEVAQMGKDSSLVETFPSMVR